MEKSQSAALAVEDLVLKGKQCHDYKTTDRSSLPTGSNDTSCAFLCFSSGTTGLPKTVVISQQNSILQIVQMCDFGSPRLLRVFLGVLPFYRTLLIRVVNAPQVSSCDIKCVGQFNKGAAPLAHEVIAKLAKLYPDVAIRQAWGMTETCSCVTVTPWNMMTYGNARFIGKIVPGTTVKVFDIENGRELGFDEPGEASANFQQTTPSRQDYSYLQMQKGCGPQVTMGYKDNPSTTKSTYDEEGYIHTGDIGLVRQDGFVAIHDRIKEMIKVKGNAVAPAELEDLLLGHPAVKDAAVIGIVDDYIGEVPMALVVLQKEIDPTPEMVRELQNYVAKHKARYKRISGGLCRRYQKVDQGKFCGASYASK
ncbi:uncharacterized protein PV09_09229 [Verruconis gallopava]|uniref:AMP-dependent synthetase/ligase domain-containing protein n=1 Tax=Verruconis gallopava TaxID=253628 RepID=A0A0D1ZX98_9PEZI|nr:uncharacterized protein PV09_09229 [Verruconis gallopava]KIV99062.1 hypothetical protein PV09_09229 [Verruconis gallopava]